MSSASKSRLEKIGYGAVEQIEILEVDKHSYIDYDIKRHYACTHRFAM